MKLRSEILSRQRHQFFFFLIACTPTAWGRKRQPTPVFLPGKSRGQRGLVGYLPYLHKEQDVTERLTMHTPRATTRFCVPHLREAYEQVVTNPKTKHIPLPDPFLQLQDLILKEAWVPLPEPAPSDEGSPNLILSKTRQLNTLQN